MQSAAPLTPPPLPASTSSPSSSSSSTSTLLRLRDACVILFTVGDRLREAYRVPSNEAVRNENIRRSQLYIRAFVVGAGALLALDVLRRYEPSLLTF